MTIQSVSLLVGHASLPFWFADAVEQLVEDTDITVSSIYVRSDTATLTERDGVVDAVRWLLRGDYHYKPVLSDPEPLVELDSVDCLTETPVSTYASEGDDPRTEVPEDVVKEITSDSDLVIQWGSGILTGAILTEPQYGVWNVHHGDTREYRGSAPGFWEFMNDEDEAGVTLIRLDESIDGGAVIARRTVDVSAVASWPEIQRRLYRASIPILRDGVQTINRGDTPASPERLGELYTADDVTATVRFRYLLKTTRGYLRGGA